MGSGSRAPHVVRVRRGLLVSCMTCPLCRKLLRDATTVSECLHTFCRKCILDKLNDDEVDSCPICHIDLGCVPAEKLRPDHNLEDIRNKIFPSKRRKTESLSLPLPIRKERSLSSLVVSTPRVASHSGLTLTGRRTKPSRRSTHSHSRGVINDDLIHTNKKGKNNFDDEKPATAPGRLGKNFHHKKQNNFDPETSNQGANKERENGRDREQFMDKTELWKPLNCLLEAANRSKTLKSGPQNLIKEEEDQINDLERETNHPKTKAKEQQNYANNKLNFEERKGSASVLGNEVPVKGRKVNIRKRKERATSARALFDSLACQRNIRAGPIWFSLVATANRDGGGLLPQLSTNYLRIKDGNLSVASIQKYITAKLDLPNEDEVEIVCRGQPVGPTMTINGLVEMWLRAESPTHKTHTRVGSPAKDFIMVLAYRHRAPCLS